MTAPSAATSNQLASEVQRLLDRLASVDAHPSSLLSLDLFVAGDLDEQADPREALGWLLPSEARPVVNVIPAKRLRNGSTAQIQAIALPGETCIASDDARFPSASKGGDFFAVAAASDTPGSSIVEQSKVGLAQLSEQLEQLGASVRDVLRFNIFYVGGGTRDDWAESARIRATHFPEPGPCATGIPVTTLSEPDTKITFHVNGVVGARSSGLITSSWPDGHWDWPMHLPYRHGNRSGNVAYTGGQVSLTPESSVIDPGNLEAQTDTAVTNIGSILAELDSSLREVVRLTAFHESRSSADADTIRRRIRKAMPDVEFELSLVGMEKLAYPDMLIEIECQAEARE